MELLRKLSINIELILQQTSCCSDIKYTCCCKILRHPKPHKSNTRWTKATTNCVLKIKFEFKPSIQHSPLCTTLPPDSLRPRPKLGTSEVEPRHGWKCSWDHWTLLAELSSYTYLGKKWACSLINLTIDHQQTFNFYHLFIDNQTSNHIIQSTYCNYSTFHQISLLDFPIDFYIPKRISQRFPIGDLCRFLAVHRNPLRILAVPQLSEKRCHHRLTTAARELREELRRGVWPEPKKYLEFRKWGGRCAPEN